MISSSTRQPSPASSTSLVSSRSLHFASSSPIRSHSASKSYAPPINHPVPSSIISRPAPVISSPHHPSVQESYGAKLEVYGDSFCSVFTLLGEDHVKVHKFKGASARGLNNPNSTLQAGPDIIRRIATTRPRYIVLQFGAVDLHINYLWQLKARGLQAIGPTEFVPSIVNNFCSFLRDEIIPMANATGMKVYIAGVLPPVVEDHYLELSISKYLQKSSSTSTHGLLPLSSSSFPNDLATRHSLVKLYNHLVSDFCARHPSCLSFVSINGYLYSRSALTKKVSKNFVDVEDPLNIHLVWEHTIQLWCREIPILRNFLPILESRIDQLESGLSVWEDQKRERRRIEQQQQEQARKTKGRKGSGLVYFAGAGGKR
ncbi:uncharacterized protein JCM6883_005150 [Sporobolomyces salmoneus]|uniref:uncharacterized protein n=1 Tax=Sporobolomyces salmoneus TaxID=183962 RepID=UPI003176CC0C